MAFSTQNFTGVLHGTNVNELNKKIDYKKTKLEERKKVVEGILGETEFYNEYFSHYFKGSITAGDVLSQEVNVCKSLERMASYLLNSDEIKAEEDKEVTQYVFHTDSKYFQKKIEREKSLEALAETPDGGHTDTVIHFLKREEKNHKKPKTQFITKQDLDRTDWLGEILRSLNSYNEFITKELKNPETKYNRYLLTKIKGQLSLDMTYVKDHLLGVFGEDFVSSKESTQPDFDIFDFTNKMHLLGTTVEIKDKKGKVKKEHIKGLLYFKPEFDPNNDFSFILKDLQETIDKANLTPEEKFVLEQMRNGSTKVEVAQQLNTHHVKIVRTMEIIASKIIRLGNKYDGKKSEEVH